MNVFTHRRQLVERMGGFDESLPRLNDWDLVLKYSNDSSPAALPIASVLYRDVARPRLSTSEPASYADHRVRSKWKPVPAPSRPMRVLYALFHYPQASETYIETEIQFMRRLGVHIEVWSQAYVATPYETNIPVHTGTLKDAIELAKPNIIHVHWLSSALEFAAGLQNSGLPLTARAHGFEANHDVLGALLLQPHVKGIFLYAHQAVGMDMSDSRLCVIHNGFDPELFVPEKNKDRSLVVRGASGLASKELGFFLELAKRLRGHKFVLAAIACSFREAYIEQLLQMREQLGSPAEILINVPHQEMAGWIGRAGIYLHTLVPPGEPDATPVGQPISIAEAMATGSYVLTRDLPPLREYVGDAGAGYTRLDDAERLIQATMRWSEAEWQQAYCRSVEKAWSKHVPERSLMPIYDAWREISEAHRR
jgi:glycosyltransferase involved in cell wall biosynthesis